MSKKQSFFERLAGNLRFDDSEDEVDVAPEPRRDINRTLPQMPEPAAEKREVPVHVSGASHDHHTVAPAHVEEEVGELPVDVYETANEIIIQTLIAGVLPEHLSINITRDVVTISGKREENRAITDDQYCYRELYWGAFGRTVELPSEVEIDSAEAIERHGMLMIKLPKLDKRRKTVLKIKSI